MSLDPRIGNQFLKAGIDYGGPCFPKDVKALITSTKSVDYKFATLEVAQLVNINQRKLFTNKILNFFKVALEIKS